ncbi:MAG: prephenate/arogenate dehydrogenase family protein [Proteobacteria bacterium]|nr:prephenate/arogenate dehydrogenase family protein [Pseudomonadota bacterium]
MALVGIGLIGSSLARAVRREGLAGEVAIATRRRETLEMARELKLGDAYWLDPAEAVRGADIVVICTPLGAYRQVAEAMAPALAPGAIVTDVGSVKSCFLKDVVPLLPGHVRPVAGHPVAGTEHSGPAAGFPELFAGRWTIVTPTPESDPDAVDKVAELWRRVGSEVEFMEARHHDQVLAITSHLPHLIAYTIVGTATDLEDDLKGEVIRFSASGFRDFTRIAASDPVMWRDVFLANREAVLDILGRFDEDLTALKRAIRRGDGQALEDHFTRTRAIRRGVIDARQDRPDLPPETPETDDDPETA